MLIVSFSFNLLCVHGGVGRGGWSQAGKRSAATKDNPGAIAHVEAKNALVSPICPSAGDRPTASNRGLASGLLQDGPPRPTDMRFYGHSGVDYRRTPVILDNSQ